ncbi:NAD(P)H-dependent flavin oxidoreductase [Chachezhania sediminis]|uniref:NAD(P)H-dependent flavin oxidoreductase n=1 Tax=Chachezhania sediminis TaxID=2599291 RepID=UPI00131CBF4F|nr:nitronate monooxygenase [Chachezhania sediminis]
MTLPKDWHGRLSVPVIAAPMFLVSTPELVTACCLNGVLGTFPALNQRTTDGYALWLDRIEERLDGQDAAPFGVNLVVHRSNARLAADLEVTVRRRVPLVITSLGVEPEVIAAVHETGGLVFHDVTTRRFAERAITAGVDGLIAVAQGAGGHAGALNPFALVAELRRDFAGPLVLGGALTHGTQVAAAQLMGADMAYIGTRFIATPESSAQPGHRDMILDGGGGDVALSAAVSGVPANFLRASLAAAGIDPDGAEIAHERNFGTTGNLRPWRDIWAAGQGIGSIGKVEPAAKICREMARDYRAALEQAPGLAAGLRT